MSFSRGLKNARSYIVFIVALSSALAVIVRLQHLQTGDDSSPAATAVNRGQARRFVPPPLRQLTPEETAWAKTAWKYFENNSQPSGLVNSVDNYPSATLWDTGSYLFAVVAANRLGIIEDAAANAKLRAALNALARLDLVEGELPNKSYNTQSLALVDYDNRPSSGGIGSSAVDTGRLLAALHTIAWNYGKQAAGVQAAIRHWNLERMVRGGKLFGSEKQSGTKAAFAQEGRLGYEQYAAHGFALLNFDVDVAMDAGSRIKTVEIDGVNVPVDRRETVSRAGGIGGITLSEPYVLDGLEYGWTSALEEQALAVYAVQEKHFEKTGTLTALTEDNVDQAPYFVYNAVFANGKPWNIITRLGLAAESFRTVSVKASFGWDALLRTSYTQRLVESVKNLNDPDRGWYAGIYTQSHLPNRAITSNTNAVVLESLYYRKFGRLVRLF